MTKVTVQDIVNTTLLNTAPEYARRIMARGILNEPVLSPLRHLWRVFYVPDRLAIDPFAGFRPAWILACAIRRTRMKNLHIERTYDVPRRVTTIRVVIDSRGWTG